MSESTRTLGAKDPVGWYLTKEAGQFMHLVRYWDGSTVRPFPGCGWGVPSSAYEVISGPLMTKEDFEQTPRVKQLLAIEAAARAYVAHCRKHNVGRDAFGDTTKAIWDAVDPVNFTPPPKPEFHLWRIDAGSRKGEIRWGRISGRYVEMEYGGTFLPENLIELDPTTGQPISSKEQSDA